MLPTARGTRAKRGDQSRFNSSAISGTPTVTGIFEFKRSDGRKFILITSENKIWLSQSGAGSFDDISKSGLAWAADSLTSFAVLNNNVVMCNRAGDTPQLTDGAGGTTQDVPGMSKHRYVVSHKGRLFAAGKDDYSIDYCGINDPTDWSTNGGTITNLIKDNGKITGLSPSHFNLLYIFYEGGAIYKLLTPEIGTASGWSIEPVVKGVTTLSHQSIVPVGNDIGFVSEKPAFHLISTVQEYGDLRVSELSLPVDDSWKMDLNRNPSRLEKIVSAYYGEKNLVCIGATSSGSHQNDVIYSMSTTVRDENGNFEWQKWSGLNPACMAVVSHIDRNRLFTGDYAGFVNIQDGKKYSDNGDTAITATLELPELDMGNPYARKTHSRMKYGYVSEASSDSATLTYQVANATSLMARETVTMNLDGTGFIIGTNLVGDNIGGRRVLVDEVELRNTGETITLNISHSTDAVGFELAWLMPVVSEGSF